jgi:hypothetical protein
MRPLNGFAVATYTEDTGSIWFVQHISCERTHALCVLRTSSKQTVTKDIFRSSTPRNTWPCMPHTHIHTNTHTRTHNRSATRRCTVSGQIRGNFLWRILISRHFCCASMRRPWRVSSRCCCAVKVRSCVSTTASNGSFQPLCRSWLCCIHFA